MTSSEPPGLDSVDTLRLRLELERLRIELAEWRARAAELGRREDLLASGQATLREARLAALNLIEDAVDARNRMAGANEALQSEVRAREQAQADTLRERDLLREVLDSLPGVFYLLDVHGSFLRWNRGFEDATGYAEDEIALMHPLDFFGDEADRELIAERIGRVFTAGQSDAEAAFTAKDGSSVPYYFGGRLILIDGEPCLVGMGFDISERRRAETARRALEVQLRESQKMEAVGTLAGGIAHDFNNILAGLLGQAVLVFDQLPQDHPARAGLRQMQRGAQRARSLVQQILAFSRRSPPEFRAQALRPLVEEALEMLRATVPAGVTLKAELHEDSPWADVDATQIEQVLLNLGTNAWHALRGEAGHIVVTLQTLTLDNANGLGLTNPLPAGRYAVIGVRDSGVGMDTATLGRIFEPFFTTKPVGSGTGLGLSVAHGIVAAHGGAIAVASQPDRGAHFQVWLPAVVQDDDTHSGFAGLGPDGTGQGECVLLVDDDETVAMVAGALLERSGFRTAAVADAALALKALAADPLGYALVLTDYNMPGMSGLELARRVRAQHPGLPIIVSTGHVDPLLQQASAASLIDAVLNKERLVEDMVPLVARVLCGTDTD